MPSQSKYRMFIPFPSVNDNGHDIHVKMGDGDSSVATVPYSSLSDPSSSSSAAKAAAIRLPSSASSSFHGFKPKQIKKFVHPP